MLAIISQSAEGEHYLCDAQRSPFFLPQQFQRALGAVEIVRGDLLQHIFRQLHMAIFIFVV